MSKHVHLGSCFRILAGVVLLFFIHSSCYAQTPGLIYKQAGNTLGRLVLDPNGDGFVSATSAGFSGGNDVGAASELPMI